MSLLVLAHARRFHGHSSSRARARATDVKLKNPLLGQLDQMHVRRGTANKMNISGPEKTNIPAHRLTEHSSRTSLNKITQTGAWVASHATSAINNCFQNDLVASPAEQASTQVSSQEHGGGGSPCSSPVGGRAAQLVEAGIRIRGGG